MGEAEKFWSEFEAQTKETVVSRAMGIWHERGDEKGPWGIVILTDKAFRFKYMPSDNLVLGLFRPPEGKGARREAVDIVVPFDQVASVIEAERSLLSRIFGSPFRRFRISWSEPSDAEPRQEDFSVDPSGEFLARLRQAVKGRDA